MDRARGRLKFALAPFRDANRGRHVNAWGPGGTGPPSSPAPSRPTRAVRDDCRPLPTGKPSRRAPNSRSPWRTRSTGGTALTHAPRPLEPGHGVGVDPAEERLADDEPSRRACRPARPDGREDPRVEHVMLAHTGRRRPEISQSPRQRHASPAVADDPDGGAAWSSAPPPPSRGTHVGRGLTPDRRRPGAPVRAGPSPARPSVRYVRRVWLG